MQSPKKSPTIRRSIAVPASVVEAARAAAPPELRDNLNRLTIVALEEYAAHRRAEQFERAMAEMAGDPAIRKACKRIEIEFASAEADGLSE